MLHIDALRRLVPVLGLLLRRQVLGLLACLAPLLFVGQQHLRHALVGQVRPPRRLRVLPGRRAPLIQSLVGERAGMARLDGKDLAAPVRDDLRLQGMALLLARVEPPLGVGQAGPGDRRLEAVHEQDVERVRVPGRLALGPLLLGLPPVRRAQVAQEPHHVVEAILADVGADAERLADDGVGDVVAQVDQSEQHLLVRVELAASAAAGAALAVGPGRLLGQPACGQLRQDGREKLAQGGRIEAEQGADAVSGEGLQLLKVHASIFGRPKTILYYTEHLL